MGAYENLIANVDKTAYTSVWDMDKIIGIAEGTINAAAPTPGPPVITQATSSTTFADTYYFQGIFSTDNGATWNDFNSMIPDLSTPGMPVFQTVNVFGAVGSSGTMNIVSVNYYDSVHGTGTAKTILWKVIYISKNNQGNITPSIIGDITLFTSRLRNYQKIALKGEVAFNLMSGVANSVTINHNLGYVPKIRYFYQELTPTNRMVQPSSFYGIAAKISETQLIFDLPAAYSTYTGTGNIEYRIYYDG